MSCRLFIITLLLGGCITKQYQPPTALPADTTVPETAIPDNTHVKEAKKDSVIVYKGTIETGVVKREEILSFAHSLMGTPYRYASTDPNVGFDCSGFITYVFNHFGISVPRSSVDFTHEGVEVAAGDALPGDLILFTGTDSTDRTVGHMGIVWSNEPGKLEFIHSSSGKANGVTISPLERYYRGRFVKVIRVFKD